MPATTASTASTAHHLDRATPFDTCPRCGGHRFHVERTDDGVAFRCQGCAARWQYELGYLRFLA
jgi:transposase-like protein